MLVMFKANNYMSFKDDVILDLRKANYREHMNHVFLVNNEVELLKTVAIYGANASGKSNLISAISSYRNIIVGQLFSEESREEDNDNNIKANNKKIRSFLLNKSSDEIIEFEMVFSYKDTLFQYGYSIEKNIIKTEWLYIDNKEIYDRKNNTVEIKTGTKYEKILKNYTKLREDRLYIALLDYFVTEEILKEKINIFTEYIKEKLNIYFEIIIESTIKGVAGMVSISDKLVENDTFRMKVSEYISKIDVGIKEIIVDEEVVTNRRTGDKRKEATIKCVHNVYDAYGEIIGEKAFELYDESSGTIRFISFIQNILELIEEGGVFVVDELSSRLHPLLTKFIVDIFQSDVNKKNAQLIFTTHDLSLLNGEQFRRDEIVLMDKNEQGVSNIYSLADLGVRKDASYSKDYLKGKYGAIPIIKESINKRDNK